MNWLGIVGDALWIVSLSIMASASHKAWARVPAETKMPLQFARDGRAMMRVPRHIALLLIPGVAFLLSLVLLWQNREIPPGTPDALVLFGIRATLAGLFALYHLRWLQAAMTQLDQEGALKS